MTRTGRTVTIAAAATLLALSAPAALGADQDDDPVLDELRRLRERVGQLEDWKTAREAEDAARENDEESELSEAIRGWLDEHGTEAGVLSNVSAPRLRRLRFGGQLRMRFEKNRKSYTMADRQGSDTNDFVLNRARLNATVDVSDDLDAFIEFQDVRVWGFEPATAANTGNADLSEGWIRFRNLADENWSAKVGRQKVALSDQRFIGHLEWANNGRRFDGVTSEYQGDGYKVVGLATRLVEGGVEPASPGDPFVSGGDNDANLYGVWGFFPHLALNSTLELFGLLVDDGRDFAREPRFPRTVSTGVGDTSFGTYGARFHGKDDDSPLDWDFQGAIQRGDLAGDDLKAWAGRGEVGYLLSDEGWKPHLSVQYNYATGEEKTNDGDHEQFQVLFPTNHGHYGISDYAAWSNTESWAATLSVKPSEKTSLTASYWTFRLDETAGGWVVASGATLRPGANTGLSRELGQEFDVVFNYRTNEWLSWQFGWSHFWAGDFVKDTQTAESTKDTDFIYVQLLVGF